VLTNIRPMLFMSVDIDDETIYTNSIFYESVFQDGTENRLIIVRSLFVVYFYFSVMFVYLARDCLIFDGHRQKQTLDQRWQERRQEESVRSRMATSVTNESCYVFMSSADPFSKKDWYDIKAPANFETRTIGRTLCTRTTGTSQ
jgi:hypothetical protein